MADDMDRGSASRGPARSESDPLAELARLIGQNDPFAGAGRAGPKVQVPPKVAPEPVVRAPEPLSNDPLASAGPPPWMQQRGGSRPEAPRQPQQPPAPDQNFQEPVHPLHRYGAAQPAPQQQAFEDPAFPEEDEQNEPSRYDDALFGQLDRGGQDLQRHQDYADDPYAFEEEDGYDEGEEEEDQKRGGGFAKVLMVLTLAVVGTGGAFAYRAYVGSPQNVDPPIIRADNSPTKIVPSPSDGSPKVPDRLGMGERTEKLVSREEAPVDINSRSGGPRVVFPQVSQGGNPPPVPPMNVATNDPPPPPPSAPVAAPPSSGTTANGEPRRIKTLSVRSDQAEPAAAPAAAPPMTRSITAKPGRNPPASANASANTPMSLSPQAAAPAAAESRMASTNATQGADTGVTPTNGYLVQVSSQRSEADAQTSYRSLQTKFPDMLGQRPPVIKRADLGEKGIYYRAMVGPFGTPDEAVQMCNSLKTAGGQCVVQKK